MAETMEENKEETDEEVDIGEGSSTGELALKQVLVLWATMPTVPGFWMVSLSD